MFVTTPEGPKAVPVRTGLTDLDYTEVVSGLKAGDSVLVLPSASLVQSQQEFKNRDAEHDGRRHAGHAAAGHQPPASAHRPPAPAGR